MRRRWDRIRRIMLRSLWRFLFDDAFALASNIAFSVLLSLFPFLIVLAAVPAYWGGENLVDKVREGMFSALPEYIASALEPEVVAVLAQGGSVLTFGILVLLITITGAVESVRAGLNRAYGGRDRRSFLFRRLQSLAFVVAGGAVLLITALLAVVAPIVWSYVEPHIPAIAEQRTLFDTTRFLTITILLTLFLYAMHIWLPARRYRLAELTPGIAATMVLWFSAGFGFSYYLSHFSTYARTYAGLAGIVATLVFFYIAAAILLYGAELNAALLRAWPENPEKRDSPSDDVNSASNR
ncbi:MAG: YihY/virulence factor BrkB family protein [Hyphomicrobiales bacterium]|nr:YihY/virulence factor BrkB family protein [Hyphomicrobiales bacterium]